MALECVCFPVPEPKVIKVCAVQSGKGMRAKRNQPKYCKDNRKPKADIDICKILERSQDERNKHNSYECHLKGEKRQNLINKIKMFLDDYDDRPVMKRKSKEGEGKALGKTGFGPLIKYPGYVDYDHPYFTNPYNKMPTLATTVGQRGVNPCPPISVRNWDACQSQAGSKEGVQGYGVRRDVGEKSQEGYHCVGRSGEMAQAGYKEGVQGYGVRRDVGERSQGGCHCARRSGEVAKCTAASAYSLGGGGRGWAGGRGWSGGRGWAGELGGYQCSSPALICDCTVAPMSSGPPTGGLKYYCYPFPEC